VSLPPTIRDDRPLTGLPPGSRISDPDARRRNDAVGLSLVCAILWPICFVVPIVVMQLEGRPILPGWLTSLTGFGLVTAPVVGILAGAVALYRALRFPALRGAWWMALVGLLVNLLWLAGIRLL
jgi:hypothetical protein